LLVSMFVNKETTYLLTYLPVGFIKRTVVNITA